MDKPTVTISESLVLGFCGYLTAALPELHKVHPQRVADAWATFRSRVSSGEFGTPDDSKRAKLLDELGTALNRYNIEGASNTPDFLLAEYVGALLDAYAAAVTARDKWFGIDPWRRGDKAAAAIGVDPARPGGDMSTDAVYKPHEPEPTPDPVPDPPGGPT